jgi:hypothetical protein
MSILQICEWIGNTSVSVGIRESIWTYPIIESAHVLGLTLFLGLLLLWDTRLLGIVLRRVPVSALWRQLFPWIAFGAIVITISGTLLFWSDPVKFYGNIFFRIKVVALVLAAASNAGSSSGTPRRHRVPRKLPARPRSPSGPSSSLSAGSSPTTGFHRWPRGIHADLV